MPNMYNTDFSMADKQVGISIRFIRSWKPEPHPSPRDVEAWSLMLADQRDVSSLQKMMDAYTFLNEIGH